MSGVIHDGRSLSAMETKSFGGLSPRQAGSPSSLSVATMGRHSPLTSSSGNVAIKDRSGGKSKTLGHMLSHLFNKSKSTSNISRGHSSKKAESKRSKLMNKSPSISSVDGGGRLSGKSRSAGRHSLNKSRSIGNVLDPPPSGKSLLSGVAMERSGYRLSVDGRDPQINFGRVSSAGTCGVGERALSSSPLLYGSTFHLSPLYLSQASLTSQSSITSQVLETAERLGMTTSLEYLVEDAKALHKKLLALSLDLDLSKITGVTDKVGSVTGERGRGRASVDQAWKEKSSTSFENSGSKDDSVPRPSVGDLVDELTEVEQQIRGGRAESISTNEGGTGNKRNITASTATLELDELMQNLSKFEASNQSQGGGEGVNRGGSQKSKSAMDDLSSMLTSLDQDMTTRHGVNTMAKGVCAACNKPILNKVMKALGREWHPEHFTCACCDIELCHSTYYESNGRPYCEKDYNELYAPRCAYCNGPILERVMRALDRTWHPEHFFCTLCGKHFGTEGFHQKDGKAFCRECYYEKFAPRCRRCDKAIMEGFITAINAQWHPECFSCKICGVTFPRGNYFEHEGEPHCEIHYHASRGTLCNSCQKPVTGKCITAMGKKWHPEHFNCAFCLKLLNKGTFKEHRQNPYCHPCYIKLFG